MKKTFSFTAKNKIPARQVEAIKHDVKKYLAREQKKKLPEGADFWEFDCRFGFTEEAAEVIKISEIRPSISKAFDEGQEGFYLEILAKPGSKPKKSPVTSNSKPADEQKD